MNSIIWLFLVVAAILMWSSTCLLYKAGAHDVNEVHICMKFSVCIGVVFFVISLVYLIIREENFTIFESAVKYWPMTIFGIVYVIVNTISFKGYVYNESMVESPVEGISGGVSTILLILAYLLLGRVSSIAALNAFISSRFATAWIGILDTRTMVLQYTNAGHNYPLFQRKGQTCEEMGEVHGLFLAGMEFTRYKQTELQLEQGDRILLFTDGITEAHDVNNELYGTQRLMTVMENTKDMSGEQVLERIIEDVNKYARGVPQFDDMTMIVLSIKNNRREIK